MIELYNSEDHRQANTLKFNITAENATTSSIDLPLKFGQSTLVIDDDNYPSGGITWSGGEGEEVPGED